MKKLVLFRLWDWFHEIVRKNEVLRGGWTQRRWVCLSLVAQVDGSAFDVIDIKQMPMITTFVVTSVALMTMGVLLILFGEYYVFQHYAKLCLFIDTVLLLYMLLTKFHPVTWVSDSKIPYMVEQLIKGDHSKWGDSLLYTTGIDFYSEVDVYGCVGLVALLPLFVFLSLLLLGGLLRNIHDDVSIFYKLNSYYIAFWMLVVWFFPYSTATITVFGYEGIWLASRIGIDIQTRLIYGSIVIYIILIHSLAIRELLYIKYSGGKLHIVVDNSIENINIRTAPIRVSRYVIISGLIVSLSGVGSVDLVYNLLASIAIFALLILEFFSGNRVFTSIIGNHMVSSLTGMTAISRETSRMSRARCVLSTPVPLVPKSQIVDIQPPISVQPRICQSTPSLSTLGQELDRFGMIKHQEKSAQFAKAIKRTHSSGDIIRTEEVDTGVVTIQHFKSVTVALTTEVEQVKQKVSNQQVSIDDMNQKMLMGKIIAGGVLADEILNEGKIRGKIISGVRTTSFKVIEEANKELMHDKSGLKTGKR